MKKGSSSPTMKDVAQEAGVALGTVSKVFNDLPVGESYRIRVEEAARKLGYQVNSYARGLKTNRTSTIALILPSLRHPFFAQLADEAAIALKEHGYRMLLATTDYDKEAEQQCLRMVRQNKVEGIIALTYNNNLKIDDDLPFVSIDRYFGTSIPCVTSDNFGGGQMAAAKLRELGCKNLLFLRLGSNVLSETDKRGAGFENYCRSSGLPCHSFRCNDADGIDAVFRYLDEHFSGGVSDFDGIFCCTDYLAYRVSSYLKEKGFGVPEDIQIIGFDGIRHFLTQDLYCSTIVQPVESIARTAVSVLLDPDRSSFSALISLPVTYQAGPTTRD